SYPAEGGIFRNPGISEYNIELALLPLYLCEETIKIAKVRHVPPYTRYISSNLPYRRSQLRITATCYKNICAFVHKLLRRRETYAAVATSNECNFSLKFAHVFLL